jgi:hypothetical protein
MLIIGCDRIPLITPDWTHRWVGLCLQSLLGPGSRHCYGINYTNYASTGCPH